MKTLKKRKGTVYDPGLPAPLPPFKPAAGGVKCDFCENPAEDDVNLPGEYVGFLCGECKKERLPYPYNGAAEPPPPGEGRDKKNADDIFMEGMRYYSGDGTEQDRVKALEFFTKAARLGHAEAQHNVGLCHKYGWNGKALDIERAVWWFEKAAGQGYTDARYDLAKYYFSGGGGRAPDYVKAAKWFASAAGSGHAGAQNDLGKCYAEGRGVEQDYKKAKAWWKKAAAAGHAGAKENLEKLKNTARKK